MNNLTLFDYCFVQRPGSGRPTSANRKKSAKSDKSGALYKVAVTTADKKNAGTDAKVCGST